MVSGRRNRKNLNSSHLQKEIENLRNRVDIHSRDVEVLREFHPLDRRSKKTATEVLFHFAAGYKAEPPELENVYQQFNPNFKFGANEPNMLMVPSQVSARTPTPTPSHDFQHFSGHKTHVSASNKKKHSQVIIPQKSITLKDIDEKLNELHSHSNYQTSGMEDCDSIIIKNSILDPKSVLKMYQMQNDIDDDDDFPVYTFKQSLFKQVNFAQKLIKTNHDLLRYKVKQLHTEMESLYLVNSTMELSPTERIHLIKSIKFSATVKSFWSRLMLIINEENVLSVDKLHYFDCFKRKKMSKQEDVDNKIQCVDDSLAPFQQKYSYEMNIEDSEFFMEDIESDEEELDEQIDEDDIQEMVTYGSKNTRTLRNEASLYYKNRLDAYQKEAQKAVHSCLSKKRKRQRLFTHSFNPAISFRHYQKKNAEKMNALLEIKWDSFKTEKIPLPIFVTEDEYLSKIGTVMCYLTYLFLNYDNQKIIVVANDLRLQKWIRHCIKFLPSIKMNVYSKTVVMEPFSKPSMILFDYFHFKLFSSSLLSSIGDLTVIVDVERITESDIECFCSSSIRKLLIESPRIVVGTNDSINIGQLSDPYYTFLCRLSFPLLPLHIEKASISLKRSMQQLVTELTIRNNAKTVANCLSLKHEFIALSPYTEQQGVDYRELLGQYGEMRFNDEFKWYNRIHECAAMSPSVFQRIREGSYFETILLRGVASGMWSASQALFFYDSWKRIPAVDTMQFRWLNEEFGFSTPDIHIPSCGIHSMMRTHVMSLDEAPVVSESIPLLDLADISFTRIVTLPYPGDKDTSTLDYVWGTTQQHKKYKLKTEDSGKLSVLTSLIDGALEKDGSTVVVTSFTDLVHPLAGYLTQNNYKAKGFSGNVKSDADFFKLTHLIDAFNNEDVDVLILNSRLNEIPIPVENVHTFIIFDCDLVPAGLQAMLHLQFKLISSSVTNLYHIITPNTVEEVCLQLSDLSEFFVPSSFKTNKLCSCGEQYSLLEDITVPSTDFQLNEYFGGSRISKDMYNDMLLLWNYNPSRSEFVNPAYYDMTRALTPTAQNIWMLFSRCSLHGFRATSNLFASLITQLLRRIIIPRITSLAKTDEQRLSEFLALQLVNPKLLARKGFITPEYIQRFGKVTNLTLLQHRITLDAITNKSEDAPFVLDHPLLSKTIGIQPRNKGKLIIGQNQLFERLHFKDRLSYDSRMVLNSHMYDKTIQLGAKINVVDGNKYPLSNHEMKVVRECISKYSNITRKNASLYLTNIINRQFGTKHYFSEVAEVKSNQQYEFKGHNMQQALDPFKSYIVPKFEPGYYIKNTAIVRSQLQQSNSLNLQAKENNDIEHKIMQLLEN
ncbi:hypothetical protein PCE1_001698 [Barthelona sp. PCE]